MIRWVEALSKGIGIFNIQECSEDISGLEEGRSGEERGRMRANFSPSIATIINVTARRRYEISLTNKK